MRILVLSDIHANWPALAAAAAEPHDVCLVLGDLVDYGPDPSECVRWTMTHANHAIRGNHDHGVAQEVPVRGEIGYRYLTRITRPHQWPALDAEERRFLLQLPLTKRFILGGKRFLLVHGTPRDPLDEYVKRDPAIWAKRLAKADADIVCVGHTHMQFQLEVNGTVVLNPGSVGQPRDGDPRAGYAIIEDGRITLKRVDYPVDETIAHIAARDWPDRAKLMMSDCLRQGRLRPTPSLQGTTAESS